MAVKKRTSGRKTSAKKAGTKATGIADLFARATAEVTELVTREPAGMKSLIRTATKEVKSGMAADKPFVYAPVTKGQIKCFLELAGDDTTRLEAAMWLVGHGVSESSIFDAVTAIQKDKTKMAAVAKKKLERAVHRFALTGDLLEMWALFLMKLEELEEV
jgi:hypothetical protein